MWEECFGKVYIGEVVGCKFCGYQIEIDGFGFCKIKRALDTAVEECAVEGRVCFEDSKLGFRLISGDAGAGLERWREM